MQRAEIRGEKLYHKTLYEEPSMLRATWARNKIILFKPNDFKTIREPVSFQLDFHVTNANRKDLDNLVKGALDLLTDRAIIIDDSLVVHIEATKHSIDTPELEKIEIQIYRWVISD